MSWVEIKLEVPRQMRDAVANRLFELGAQGVREDELEQAQVLVNAYFDRSHPTADISSVLEAYLHSIKDFYPTVRDHDLIAKPIITEIEQGDWATQYKRYYSAQKLSRHVFLKPAWDESTETPPGYVRIVMDPGQAFGTGLHPTTQGSLRLLERALEFYPNRKRVRALDVGTGSAILAIAAAKLGVGHIDAIDNDPIAVEVAVQNCKLNGCSDVSVLSTPLGELTGTYDIVLANILLEAHHTLCGEYTRLLNRGGQLILAGLLVQEKSAIESLIKASGLTIEISEVSQEWLAVLCTKTS